MVDLKLNIKDYINNLRLKSISNKDNTFPYQGLWIVTGTQGAGKTLNALNLVLEIHKQYPKALIVSNISLYGVPCIPYRGIEDFDKYNNGSDGIIYLIDEIHTLYSSLESKHMPVSSLTVWSQNRKNKRVIIGTSQRYSRVAKGLREQCAWHIETRPPIFNLYRYRYIDASFYDDNGNYIGEKIPNYSFYCPLFRSFLSYNTNEIVFRDGNNKSIYDKE